MRRFAGRGSRGPRTCGGGCAPVPAAHGRRGISLRSPDARSERSLSTASAHITAVIPQILLAGSMGFSDSSAANRTRWSSRLELPTTREGTEGFDERSFDLAESRNGAAQLSMWHNNSSSSHPVGSPLLLALRTSRTMPASRVGDWRPRLRAALGSLRQIARPPWRRQLDSSGSSMAKR